MSGTYTEQMESVSYNVWNKYDEYGDIESSVDFLNSDNGFRTFGDGLTAIIIKKYPEMANDNILKFITVACARTGVEMQDIGSINTLKNWFYGDKRPKKGEGSRDSMFALAFALSLTPAETAELFHKVYLDRAFDFRNEKEVVYYFCLANGKKRRNAEQIIAMIDHNFEYIDRTIYSSAIRYDIMNMKDEECLVNYINTHRHNLEICNVTAKAELEKLINKAKKFAKEEAELPEHIDQFNGTWKNSDAISINFLYTVITDITPSAKKGTTTVFKNARLPQEIKNRFPEAGSFSDKNPSYESIRKMIILLFSYNFWYQVQWKRVIFDIEDYTNQLNFLLCECGFASLYYGNPFDWMFLSCTLSENPLDMFREILSEVFEYHI